MKSFLLATLAALSLNAYSQSYLILENGITITTDTSGFSYDFGHYTFPSKVLIKGGQYFVEEGGILTTIDENGLLYRKYELIPAKILGKGLNYFISTEGFFYAFDKRGYLKVTESEHYMNATKFGGNYFTVASDPEETAVDFYVVTSEGLVNKIETPEFDPKDIVSFGGNYFMTNRGIVYTISNTGDVAIKENVRVGVINKKGGNFFTDSSGYFFTVTEKGELSMPSLPLSMHIPDIHKTGSNYFLDQFGRFFVVDKNGKVFEKIMPEHDFMKSKVISL
jgi:hypothetical protein